MFPTTVCYQPLGSTCSHASDDPTERGTQMIGPRNVGAASQTTLHQSWYLCPYLSKWLKRRRVDSLRILLLLINSSKRLSNNLSFEICLLCELVRQPRGVPKLDLPDVNTLIMHINISSNMEELINLLGWLSVRVNFSGQCLHVVATNGFVTPTIMPARGGKRFTKQEKSLSCTVKYGRKSPAKGI